MQSRMLKSNRLHECVSSRTSFEQQLTDGLKQKCKIVTRDDAPEVIYGSHLLHIQRVVWRTWL
jgi:hypothetical protein